MFVFGDAERMVWQARDFHKFLVHKFLRRYFGVDFRIWARRRRKIFGVFETFLKGTLQKADIMFYRVQSGFGSRLVFFVAIVCRVLT